MPFSARADTMTAYERSRRQNKCLHALDYSVERCPTDNWQLPPRLSSLSIWQSSSQQCRIQIRKPTFIRTPLELG
jgi:hypothetical protein